MCGPVETRALEKAVASAAPLAAETRKLNTRPRRRRDGGGRAGIRSRQETDHGDLELGTILRNFKQEHGLARSSFPPHQSR